MIVRAALSVLLSAVTMLGVWAFVPARFRPNTEMIGYPAFANYNIDRHFEAYLLLAFGLPLLTAVLFLRFRRVRFPWEKTTPVWFAPWLAEVPEPAVPATAWTAKAGRLGRLWFTGLVFALGTVGLGPGRFLPRLALGAALYGGLVYAFAFLLRKRVPEGRHVGASWANLLLSAFLPFVLFGLSEGSQIGGVTHRWFPFWLAALSTVGLGAWILKKLKGVEDAEGVVELESAVFFRLTLPLFLFASMAEVPIGRSWLHLHHDGESLVPAWLVSLGWVPWRDFLFQHGLLQDPFLSWVGHRVFEDSVWGSDAGVQLILKPGFLIAQYALLHALLRRQPWLLWLAAVVLPDLVPLFRGGFNFRFVLLFPIFALLKSTFERRSRRVAALVGALAVISVGLTPETLFLPIAVAVALLSFEAYHRDASAPPRQAFSLSLAAAAGALGAAIAFAGVLAAFGALKAYLQCYGDLAAGHRYSVGLPISWEMTSWFRTAILLPWIAYFGSAIYFVFRFRAGRFLPRDAVMLGWNVFSILYYPKFLARADEHILAHTVLAAPVFYWWASEAAAWLERHLENRLPFAWRGVGLQPVAIALGVGLTLSWIRPLAGYFSSYALRFHRGGIPRSDVPRWGYGNLREQPIAAIRELKAFFDANRLPDEGVFDFTNEPALFHYLLGFRPPLRHHYPYANTTVQRRIVDELREKRPEWVVFLSTLPYARFDQVPSQVRYHAMARYVLDAYEPFASFEHHLILRRRDLKRSLKPVPGLVSLDRQYAFEPCDWGYAPALGVPWPEGPSGDVVFSTRRFGSSVVTELELPKAKRDTKAIEIEFDGTVPDSFYLTDGVLNRSNANGGIAFRTLDAGRTSLRIPVSSCVQWRGFHGDTLYLTYRNDQAIKAIRLIGDPSDSPERAVAGH